ncbi:MAG: polysaccharide biosynthesis/export family protein, partial [Kiritimatiellia bacterium]
KIYRDVTVRVVVPNTFYFIGGEVRQPGRFPMVGRVTLSQAVVAAGNFTEWANERQVILVRNNERVMINFRKIKENPNLDVELLAGDVITVERSTF